MSETNVELVRRAYAERLATGHFLAEDVVWDMSNARWPEQKEYEGIAEVRSFLRDWTSAFDDWRFEVEAIHDAGGNKVVAIVRQQGRSKSTGLPVDMVFAQVFTIRDGKLARMEMYADPTEALKAVGLEE